MPVLIKVSQNQIKEAKSFGKFYATWGLAPAINVGAGRLSANAKSLS